MSKILPAAVLLLSILLLPGLASGGEGEAHQARPLETWGIKTSDYHKVAKFWADDTFYADVPPPDCARPHTRGMKLLCSRQDFRNIAWYARRFSIYAEENATKRPLDHKKAYAAIYHTRCKSEDCLGHELKQALYQSLEDSGMEYILEDEQ